MFSPRSLHRLAVIAICCLLPIAAVAQDKSFPVAVINLDKVFNNYKKHALRLQPLRENAKELDESVQVRQVEIETTLNQLRKAMPGSQEQVRIQQTLLKLQNDLRIFVETERAKLQKREVGILITTQKDVDEQIKKICQDRGLKLVLRQNSAADESQPLPEILKNLNRDVVYQDGLDITDDVLNALNEKKPDGT
ncbi:OmpH family outer membrane protein [Anatilimnocola floriformis]|uniref:OmpH family outer membrane protein n=1 Tax=Anatilimnocola floriformis TaxID=2948575 RepID=UPI0020C44639|nr:OmpH family outer membrane protein [Anatilimnocola floriformis]